MIQGILSSASLPEGESLQTSLRRMMSKRRPQTAALVHRQLKIGKTSLVAPEPEDHHAHFFP